MWSVSTPLFLFFCGASFFVIGTCAVKSRFACEGEKLRLRCESDYVLRVFNAKYGRLEPGSSICPHENITDLNCQAEGVLLKVMAMCTNRRRCIIKADSSFFRDPCPGTYKYLEVIYRCVPGDNWTPTPTSKKSKTKPRFNRTTLVTMKSPITKRPSLKSSTDSTTGKNSSINNISGTNQSSTKREFLPTRKSTTLSFLSTWTTKKKKSLPKAPDSKASGREGEEGVIFVLLRSVYVTYRFISEQSRDTLVVFLSGVAGATVFLLLFLLAIHLCKKKLRKRKFSMVKREDEDEVNKIKSVTIELQGNGDETKEINVNPGDIIIIDHNDDDRAGSEDLGYLSEIVRFYNSQNIGSDDQISIRKQFSACDSPSVISTEASESRDSKYGSVGMKHCTCQHESLLRPSSPLGII